MKEPRRKHKSREEMTFAKCGAMGGVQRAKNLTPEQRSESARRAAKARHAKERAQATGAAA